MFSRPVDVDPFTPTPTASTTIETTTLTPTPIPAAISTPQPFRSNRSAVRARLPGLVNHRHPRAAHPFILFPPISRKPSLGLSAGVLFKVLLFLFSFFDLLFIFFIRLTFRMFRYGV